MELVSIVEMAAASVSGDEMCLMFRLLPEQSHFTMVQDLAKDNEVSSPAAQHHDIIDHANTRHGPGCLRLVLITNASRWPHNGGDPTLRAHRENDPQSA